MNMKTVFRYISSLRRDLTIVLLCSVVMLMLIDFWFIDIPELFYGAYKLGQLVYNICVSYISAFIFYFLVVHIKEQKDKNNLNTYISLKVSGVIGNAKCLIKDMAKAAQVTMINDFPSKDEMSNIYEGLDPHKDAPLLISNNNIRADWIQYCLYSNNKSHEVTCKLITIMPFLDSRLISLLSEIEDCSYFYFINFLKDTRNMDNTDMTFIRSILDEYLELIKLLEKYSKKNL